MNHEHSGAVNDTTPTLEDAIILAAQAHRGQIYPSVNSEPFILHPLRVMTRVQSKLAQVVAVLHDVIEDTNYTLDDLRRQGYADAVVEAVDCLTHKAGETYEAYIERVATNPIARQVKLADLEDNLANNLRLEMTNETLQRIARYRAAQQRLVAIDQPNYSKETG